MPRESGSDREGDRYIDKKTYRLYAGICGKIDRHIVRWKYRLDREIVGYINIWTDRSDTGRYFQI